jgi:hypothetical protein
MRPVIIGDPGAPCHAISGCLSRASIPRTISTGGRGDSSDQSFIAIIFWQKNAPTRCCRIRNIHDLISRNSGGFVPLLRQQRLCRPELRHPGHGGDSDSITQARNDLITASTLQETDASTLSLATAGETPSGDCAAEGGARARLALTAL